ncbi:Zinc finger, GATA-type [Dillenia turbinata]|uniref:GATA transcription factor n=1 Tax=Dillenia turbinata TaxID=194707 RepID=A0AAN8UG53_9MAGN
MEGPELFISGYYTAGKSQFSPEKQNNGGEVFIVEELLDFSNEDALINENFIDSDPGNSADSSTVTVGGGDSNNSSGNETHFSGNCFPDGQFSGELSVPYEDLAELEWLSNFVEESFSSEDLQKLQLISGIEADQSPSLSISQTATHYPFQPEPEARPSNPIFASDVSVPGKARSKRTRPAPCNWSSGLLILSPAVSSSEPTGPIQKPLKATKKCMGMQAGGDGRKCLHCATDKTPQWRTGPMGPKTLCNACGVRYKSGRLVPEYRPAASPTFVSTKHSNSHRKVLELRRQKELQSSQQQHQQFIGHNAIFDLSNGCDDFLIHQHTGPDFRQLI